MLRMLALALITAVMSTQVCWAGVDVTFNAPETYTDQDFRNATKRRGILNTFEKHFDRLGDRYLKPGQTLRIQVLNIDLAGDREPWRRGFGDARVLRETTPPRFKLRYALVENGKVVAKGQETVTDAAYLWKASPQMSSGRFAHEKSMLRNWFHRRFVAMKPPRG